MLGTHHLLMLLSHCTARCFFHQAMRCELFSFLFPWISIPNRTYFTVYYGRSFLSCYDILVCKHGMSVERLVLYKCEKYPMSTWSVDPTECLWRTLAQIACTMRHKTSTVWCWCQVCSAVAMQPCTYWLGVIIGCTRMGAHQTWRTSLCDACRTPARALGNLWHLCLSDRYSSAMHVRWICFAC